MFDTHLSQKPMAPLVGCKASPGTSVRKIKHGAASSNTVTAGFVMSGHSWFRAYKLLFTSKKVEIVPPENATKTQLSGWKRFRQWKHYHVPPIQ